MPDKLSLSEIGELVQGRKASKWQSQYLNMGPSAELVCKGQKCQ